MQAHVAFPTPDNSKNLALPIVPAETITSLSTGTCTVVPLLVIYSTAVAWAKPALPFPQIIRLAVALSITPKFGRSLNGV